jgi:hypothetical protein
MAEGKYGRLFTEADVHRLLRYAHDRGVTAGMLEEGAGGLAEGDRRSVPPTLREIEDEQVELTFPADEPLFLLRGQDKAARMAIGPARGDQRRMDYLAACVRAGVSIEHVQGICDAAQGMAEWQAANPDRVKVPD